MALSDYDARTTGQFPLSIATSLALEAAFGIYPDRPVVQPAPILDYDELWVNVKTLFRNFLGALDKSTAEMITSDAVVEGINGELDTIHQLVTEQTSGRTSVVFYLSDYVDIDRKYKYAVIRRDNTAKQKMYTAMMIDVIGKLLKMHPKGNIRVEKLKLHPEKKTKALILTHIAFDLVSYPEFRELTLLESHTGAIKERSQWYTRLYEGKTLSMVPFNEMFLQVFGDSQTFRPMDIKLRKEIIDLATQYRWNAATKIDFIMYGIGTLKNPYAREILTNMKNS